MARRDARERAAVQRACGIGAQSLSSLKDMARYGCAGGVVALFIVIVCVRADNNAYNYFVLLDEQTRFTLSWTPSVDNIVFRMEAKTLGYVGLGFSNSGSMVGADIVIGWVEDASGKPYLLDYHGGSKNGAPLLDPLQNYELLSASQNDTHTVISFQRQWDTCDTANDYILGNDTVRVLWALHEGDAQDEGRGLLPWHGKEWRGSKSLHLVNPPRNSPTRRHDIKHWDITLNNLTVPDNMDTLYWCKIFKVPSLGKKHHSIGYEPILQKTSKHLVHHMLLYECVGADNFDAYLDHEGAPCYSDSMPQDWSYCLTPVVAWAVGSSGEFLPEHVGLPLAEDDRSTFFMLEIHYDNPMFHLVKDNSGLRLFYTESLRQYDGAILVSGIAVSPLQIIPPHQEKYTTVGYCDFHCIQTMVPEAGINIVSVLLHSHLAGRKLALRHVRAGLELPTIAQDSQYDFNYQQSRVLPREVQILAGDELITECVYNTANRTEATVGGYSTKQEMCLAFILYYPRIPLANCLSMTPVQFFFQTFGVTKFYNHDMPTVEKMFLTLIDNQSKKQQHETTTSITFPFLTSDDENNDRANEEAISILKKLPDYTVETSETGSLFADLIIKESEEFSNRTFTALLSDLPWTEKLLTQRVEDTFYHGKHMTFCRLHNDTLAVTPQVFNFPNFTSLPPSGHEEKEAKCKKASGKLLADIIKPSNSASVLNERRPIYILITLSLLTLIMPSR